MKLTYDVDLYLSPKSKELDKIFCDESEETGRLYTENNAFLLSIYGILYGCGFDPKNEEIDSYLCEDSYQILTYDENENCIEINIRYKKVDPLKDSAIDRKTQDKNWVLTDVRFLNIHLEGFQSILDALQAELNSKKFY